MPGSADPISGARGLRRFLEVADRGLERVEFWLIVALLCLAAVMQFTQVAGRYLFAISISEFEEISVYLVLWMVFIGMGRAESLRQSIALDILYNYLPPGAARALAIARDLLLMFFGAIMAVVTAISAHFSYKLGETSVTKFAAPVWIVMAIMPPAFLLLSLRAVVRLAGGAPPTGAGAGAVE